MAEYVDSATCADVRRIDQAFLLRTFYVFIVLAIASALIAAAGRWLGPSISMGGYTDDPALREIVIGNNVLSVPANAIRFAQFRKDTGRPSTRFQVTSCSTCRVRNFALLSAMHTSACRSIGRSSIGLA